MRLSAVYAVVGSVSMLSPSPSFLSFFPSAPEKVATAAVNSMKVEHFGGKSNILDVIY